MRNQAKMLDRSIEPRHPKLRGKLGFLPQGALSDIAELHPVVRMSAIDHQLYAGLYRALAFEDPKCLIGPVDLAGCDLPAETTGLAQPLRLRQVYLAAPQGLLGLLAFGMSRCLAQCAL